MLKEKFCAYCETYYFVEEEHEEVNVRCPKCVDPNSIVGETYEKTTILAGLKRHLASNGIDASLWDEDTLISSLKEFPRANDLYFSNGSYRTITLYTGSTFEGKYGLFFLGPVLRREMLGEHKPYVVENRYIVCSRCNSSAEYSRLEALDMFVGFLEKKCKNCDIKSYIKSHKRNTKGLRKGSREKECSEKSRARALNVSRGELRANPNIEYHKPLEEGTEINGLKITEAFWDERTYSPKYRLFCPTCNGKFICLQRKVEDVLHICLKKEKVF